MQKFYSWLGAVIAACILLASVVSIPNAQAANFVVNTSNAALSGLWFNESEAGWGASLTQQGPIIFAAWYTYDASGLPAWYVMSNCAIVADACTGDIYRVTGGTKPTIAWAGATRAVSKSGSATVTFTDVNTGVFSYMLNGVTASRSITRQVFANGSTPPTMDYTGLWWNANESGWGIAITQQFSTIFATWFTYDDAGTPVWYVASNCAMTANNCNGDLYYVVGGTPPTLAWKGGARTVTKVGTININFTSGTTATLNYTINGISGSRLITPQVFYAALTVSTAPTIGLATAGTSSASIAFNTPAFNGGNAITSYTVTCSAADSVLRGSGANSPITVTGLIAGTTYSCVATATNSVGVSAASSSVSVTPTAVVTPVTGKFKGQVWADNWFALYVGDTKVAEDSAPITTERSFNSETFNFSANYPLELNFIIKDYKANDSGLEYIGLSNQQMGDGGFIMQITDTTTNKIVAVSSTAFRCLVIHKAPLNPTCEKDANPLATCQSKIIDEPIGWKNVGFNTSTWENAVAYTTTQIGVKEGYFDIAWDAAAKLIWTSDLKADNTLLCKAAVAQPTTSTVPAAPTELVATAGTTSASIAFTASVVSGGLPVSSYTATCVSNGGNLTASNSVSPIVVMGLTGGLVYTCTVIANNSFGSSAQSVSVAVTPVVTTIPSGSAFKVVSTAGVEGGILPNDYTCDGAGSTAALAWANAPAGTTEFAVLMTTLSGDGTTKWNWVLYGIPESRSGLNKDSFGMGTLGVGSDGPIVGYQPPCSQGPGAKLYTFTVYALSAAPNVSGTVTGDALAKAMASITLGTATLNLNVTRTNMAGSATACLNVRNSTSASSTGLASVGCDSNYAYVGSNGLAAHKMMDGITASNLQMPLAQNFFGANAWKIPLNPAIAAATTTAVDGPIGVAINGVPIFNPCKQGGCQNGDTKVLGELDVCNGHAGRADDYHYHAAPTCMMAGKAANYWDTHPLGWALDGFAIFGYNDATGATATRDGICGGNTSAVSNGPAGYSYHVTDASPYILSCFRGTLSPDLAGQGAKYSPIRQPPVTPFAVTNMTSTTDTSDGYQVLQFSSARAFVSTETGTDSYNNAAGTYKIRYEQLTGTALTAVLAQGQNSNKSVCWNFQFLNSAGANSQPTISYCR